MPSSHYQRFSGISFLSFTYFGLTFTINDCRCCPSVVIKGEGRFSFSLSLSLFPTLGFFCSHNRSETNNGYFSKSTVNN